MGLENSLKGWYIDRGQVTLIAARRRKIYGPLSRGNIRGELTTRNGSKC